MLTRGISTIVTGGASGLGLATARRLVDAGAAVTIADLPGQAGEEAAAELGDAAHFVAADVTSERDMRGVVEAAAAIGPLRAVIHCAGHGGALRILDKEGAPAPMEAYERVVKTNLFGSFNTLRLAAAEMAKNEPLEGDRGVVVLTASVAAFEGQIGQIPYASSKAGVVGMTIVAARDLAGRGIRVCTIAPGTFDTPLLARVTEKVRESLAASIPHPSRLGDPGEYAKTALHIIDNGFLNGETIRLDGAIRMAPR